MESTLQSDHGPQTNARQAPRRARRWRLAFFDGVEKLLARLGGRRFYRHHFLRAGRFHERHEDVPVQNLPAGLDGLRIAHLSDLHAGAFLGPGDLGDVVQRVNQLEVDLVALTGDYITHHVSDAFQLSGDLSALRSRWGTFAVFGNHDYRERREGEIVGRLAECGVRFLRNEGLRLDTGDGVLYISGVEDLEEARRIDPRAARADLQAGDVEVLLCHHPAGARSLAREGCAVVLSGHTHGGQINLPGIPQLGPRHPGNRLQHGSTTCIVSRGLGVVAIPLRFRAPAELVIVTLSTSAPAPGGA
jgi:predicted MPP superfamily phosphohydrolase